MCLRNTTCWVNKLSDWIVIETTVRVISELDSAYQPLKCSTTSDLVNPDSWEPPVEQGKWFHTFCKRTMDAESLHEHHYKSSIFLFENFLFRKSSRLTFWISISSDCALLQQLQSCKECTFFCNLSCRVEWVKANQSYLLVHWAKSVQTSSD